MTDLIRGLFSSPVLTILVMLGMLAFITSWAFRQKEYPGYLLGWLVGIFAIIVSQATSDTRSMPSPDEAEIAATTLPLLSVIGVTIIGMGIGGGVLFLLRRFVDRQVQRSLYLAFFTAMLVILLYTLSSTTGRTNQLTSIFGLAFAIGSLAVVVVGGSPRRTWRTNRPSGNIGGVGPEPDTPNDIPEAHLDRARSRFDEFRRRIDRH
ncbi:MAG: hypothetical protein ACOCXR_01260 [Phototrophicaceae bacterium]